MNFKIIRDFIENSLGMRLYIDIGDPIFDICIFNPTPGPLCAFRRKIFNYLVIGVYSFNGLGFLLRLRFCRSCCLTRRCRLCITACRQILTPTG
jgi:hypothetical protein